MIKSLKFAAPWCGIRPPEEGGKGLKITPHKEEKIAGAVAQSVEQRTENPCVAGSIPAHTTDSEINPCRSMIYEGFLLGCTERCTVLIGWVVGLANILFIILACSIPSVLICL